MALVLNRSLRLPDGQYFPPGNSKSGIAVHHTVGGSVQSTFEYWKTTSDIVGTAYIIERDGTIFEVFDSTAWAWQFGLKWPQEEKIAFEKRFIGIEIASEGGITESNGKFYCFDRISDKTLKDPAGIFDYGQDYRGYRYFDKYEPAQVDSLVALIDDLCTRFGIERKVPPNFLDFYGEQLKDFKGIIGHTMVRKDKSDPLPDANLWNRIINDCGVQKMTTTMPSATPERNLTEQEIEQLFNDNVVQINKMNVAAGSLVKGLIMELQRSDRSTYLRLHDAEQDGHAVYYGFVQGDKGLVFRLARALGFADV
ncbi:MAG: N-acetylmuramoyl-L-alanine amidase, partial [Bacteroidota bacterium]